MISIIRIFVPLNGQKGINLLNYTYKRNRGVGNMVTINTIENVMDKVRCTRLKGFSNYSVEELITRVGGKVIKLDTNSSSTRSRLKVLDSQSFILYTYKDLSDYEKLMWLGYLFLYVMDGVTGVYKEGEYEVVDLEEAWAVSRFASLWMISDDDVVRIFDVGISMRELSVQSTIPVDVLLARFHMNGYLLDIPLTAS